MSVTLAMGISTSSISLGHKNVHVAFCHDEPCKFLNVSPIEEAKANASDMDQTIATVGDLGLNPPSSRKVCEL